MTHVAFALSAGAAKAHRRTLMITVSPANPSLPSTAPKGTIVATIAAHWSDGTPYSGPFSFGAPYQNYNGTFAIAGNQIIISQSGPGIAALGGKTVDISIAS